VIPTGDRQRLSEEEDRAHGSESLVAAGLAFGCLIEPVERCQITVCLAGLGQGDDAIECVLNIRATSFTEAKPGDLPFGLISPSS